MDNYERKTYKARNGHTIRTTILGSWQSEQTVYGILADLLNSDDELVARERRDGWAAFSKADARKIRTRLVADLRERIA